jgi:hypothetical protein
MGFIEAKDECLKMIHTFAKMAYTGSKIPKEI